MVNEVKLTFAGDTAQLEQAFDRVEQRAGGVDRAARDAGDGFDRASEAADNAEGKFQGTASALEGSVQSAQGFAAIAKGDLYGGAVLAAGGMADLAEGFNYTIIPMAKTLASFVAQKAAMIGHAIATTAVSAATKVWAGVQWLLNTALLANPIVLIIIAIIALVAIIVLIATKTTWFQTIWKAVWKGIMAYLNFVKGVYVGAFNLMISIAKKLIDGVMSIPGKLKKAFSGLVDIITWPWRTAFNFISRAWNATVGQLSWTVPGWVPIVGGNSISAPKLPQFHQGGVASGAMGSEFLAVLRAGERVVPTGGGQGMTVAVVAGGGGSSAERKLTEVVLELFRKGSIKMVVLPNGRVAAASG
jgi:hypothetical protein